jgi:hypothetical protein
MNVTDGLEAAFNVDNTACKVDSWRIEFEKLSLAFRVSQYV